MSERNGKVDSFRDYNFRPSLFPFLSTPSLFLFLSFCFSALSHLSLSFFSPFSFLISLSPPLSLSLSLSVFQLSLSSLISLFFLSLFPSLSLYPTSLSFCFSAFTQLSWTLSFFLSVSLCFMPLSLPLSLYLYLCPLLSLDHYTQSEFLVYIATPLYLNNSCTRSKSRRMSDAVSHVISPVSGGKRIRIPIGPLDKHSYRLLNWNEWYALKCLFDKSQ